ncbi:hypothetical protein Tco_1389285 [Tanacetum coccineum]
MASMDTRLNIEKLDGNIVQKHRGSKQVGFKQLGPGVKIGVHGVHDEKYVWFEVELQGAQRDHEAEVFQRSTQLCMKKVVSKHLGVAGIQQQNGFVNETNMTLFAKAIGFKNPIDILRFFGWLASIMQGMLEPVKVKNMGFNESGESKKTFIGSGACTCSVQVLQGVDFEVEPQEDHTFKVEPHGNVQTQDLMAYQLARDREQHLACELFRYLEDSNEAAFAVAIVEKIYANGSLTFSDTVACEAISKWKARLKEDMDVRSDVYVLSNGCRKSSNDSHDYYWEYAPGLLVKAKGNILGLEIIRDQSGNILRVSRSRIHNKKLVQTLLKGYSTLSLEDSLSGDYDVEKNGKWSYTYAVGSQEYQMVCTRLDIASADVGMLDKFDHRL